MTDRMREVELVEGVDENASLHPSDHADGDHSAAAAARSWARRNARWLVPAAVVAVLALVGTQLVADARERSRLEALAAIPGVVPPTGPDIGVIWRADPSLATMMQNGTAIDGLLIGGRATASGSVDLLAVDTDTGDVQWTTPVEVPTAHLTPDGGEPSTWVACLPVHHGDRTLATCVSQQYGDGIVGLPDTGTWVVDPTDGSVLTEHVVPGGAGVTFTDDALVVATRIASDSDAPAAADATSVRWLTSATDLVSGAALWTYTTPAVDTGDAQDDPANAGAGSTATLQAFDGRLALQVDGHAWILRDDGTVVRDLVVPEATWIQGLRSGVFMQSTYTNRDDGTLLLPDGSSVPVGETAGWLMIDDGSVPGLVFTVNSAETGVVGLNARDVATGRRAWHRDDPVTSAILLDGVLYLATEQAVEAVDATTGRTRWSSPVTFQPEQVSTDGRYLLVPGPGVTLRAYALSDGRLAWTKDLQAEVAGDRGSVYIQGFQASWHDPRLYVWMDDGAVAVLG